MTNQVAGASGCHFACLAVLALGVLAPSVSFAGVSFGQLDDFFVGTAGWSEGAPSPNPPINVATGGPGGAGDPYVLNVASGGFGAGSRQIMFNRDQWTGDFVAAGVTRIEMKLANFGATDLAIRIAFAGGASQFGSTNAFALPAGDGWKSASFDLTPAALTSLVGSETVAQSLASVTEFRLLSAAGGPAFQGDGVASSLGVDSIRALRQPGDASFDGLVNFADLVILAQHYNTVGKTSWGIGDFTFDNAVDFADLVILAQNYNSGAVTGADEADVGSASFASDWALARSMVPEPGSALLFVGALCTARRTRRHSAAGS
jgi:hypothetical protein